MRDSDFILEIFILVETTGTNNWVVVDYLILLGLRSNLCINFFWVCGSVA